MMEWLVALCIGILVAVIWSASKYFGSQGEPDALLQGLGISRRQTKEMVSERCVSDRGVPMDGANAQTSDRAGENKVPDVALICKPSALANYLFKHCRTFSNFTACTGWTWRASAFLQTVYGACWPYESPAYFVRDYLQLSDDGLVALDWAVSMAGASYQKRRRTSSNSTSPILLIIPNSFGKITRNVLKVA
ncbi:protein ABHD15-like [Oncorhynchus clarkii lewisi]|uniref:protein ABHD15-like n=1 Tax=Oncorhynchus clarkii lewisi TaxID=490388 RepID=UPI0039B9162A